MIQEKKPIRVVYDYDYDNVSVDVNTFEIDTGKETNTTVVYDYDNVSVNVKSIVEIFASIARLSQAIFSNVCLSLANSLE